MSYNGLNREEMLLVGDSRTGMPSSPTVTASSFTPINMNWTSQTVHPQDTMHLPSLESSVYDLPEDEPFSTAPPAKKRKGKQPKKAHSFAMPYTSMDTNMVEGLQEHVAFEVTSLQGSEIPSGRFLYPMGGTNLPSGRTQSMATQAPANGVVSNWPEGSPQKIDSYLSTPPHSLKKKRARTVLAIKNKSPNQQPEVFEIPSITRPTSSSHVQKSRLTASPYVKSTHGFTTTEARVRPASSGLAETTMEKLAAFRYNAKPHNITVTDELPRVPPQGGERVDTQIQLFPDGDHALEQDLVFREAALEAIKNSFNNHSPDDGHDSSSRQQVFVHPSSSAVVSSMNFCHKNDIQGHSTSRQLESATGTAGDPPFDSEPISQENMFTDGLLKERDIGICESFDQPASSSAMRAVAVAQGAGHSEYVHRALQSITLDNGLHASPNTPAGTPIRNSTVNHQTAKIVTQDHFASDEFDDGLEDDDLLALVSFYAAADPGSFSQLLTIQSPISVQATHRKKLATVEASSPGSQGSQQPEPTKRLTQSSVITLEFDEFDDNDFPMDEDMEQVLLMLTDRKMGGIERDQPPASVIALIDDGESEEVYDRSLQYSPPKPQVSLRRCSTELQVDSEVSLSVNASDQSSSDDGEDWAFIQPRNSGQNVGPLSQSMLMPLSPHPAGSIRVKPPKTSSLQPDASIHDTGATLVDSPGYDPLQPFARPPFPSLISDRCPVQGLSSRTFMRTCFRIGEMIREGGRCNSLKKDAVIELFARVTFSSRELGTAKQHFQFADLFHDRPPFSNGILANYKTTGLVESESRVLIGSKRMMVRCLGYLKRDYKNDAWLLHIINIRQTDWEEIKWTRGVVSADKDCRINWGDAM